MSRIMEKTSDAGAAIRICEPKELMVDDRGMMCVESESFGGHGARDGERDLDSVVDVAMVLFTFFLN